MGGLDYASLAKEHPLIKARFDATLIDVVTIRTDDIEMIEDMFSRLNEAVPLNAPEKRGALGGPMPAAIKSLAAHPFFSRHLPFQDERYRHRDLAAKFLYIEFQTGIPNIKKAYLDQFVKQFKEWRAKGDAKGSPSKVAALTNSSSATLQAMDQVFTTRDRLLRQVGMVTLYYHLFRLIDLGRIDPVSRKMLVTFEKDRDANREVVEASGESSRNVDTELLEFDKHSQTPNDSYAIRIRLGILLRYLKKKFKFNYQEKFINGL